MVKYPNDWKPFKINDFAKVKRGASPRPIEHFLTRNTDGVNWIKIGDAPRYGKYIESTKERVTSAGASLSVSVLPGDFILSNSMSFGRPYILKTSGCIHDGWLRLFDFADTADSDFLFYLLSSDEVQAQYRALAAGSSVQNLNKEIVKRVLVHLPSLPEQKAIAEALTSMDTHISNLTELIEKKKAIRDGALEDLVSGRTRLEGFNGKWHCNPLAKLGTFVKGAPLSKAAITSSGTPLILYGELYTTYGDVVHNVIHRTNVCVEQKYFSVTGDVIIPTSGETAEEIATAACVMQDGVILGGDLMIIKTNKLLIDGRFLSYTINHVVNRAIADIAQGISVIHIKPKEVSRIAVLYPDIDEQRAIADVIEAMDDEIASLEAERDKMQQIKAGMMDDLLAGRVRLIG